MYLCKICGNKVKVINAGIGTLLCYGQPMSLVKA
ncbi:desulfoferrodoxin FeS4 iron-binding domain-containing protein [Candidatus Bathyarchaeota archaeon]|nr:desulfoferrodoxin FeS4 iron-binding domain-containing protein [Candidatus Bathyarchaeota archaeon]